MAKVIDKGFAPEDDPRCGKIVIGPVISSRPVAGEPKTDQPQSFSAKLIDVCNGHEIFHVTTPSGFFAGYTVGFNGRSFRTLKAARTYAKRTL